MNNFEKQRLSKNNNENYDKKFIQTNEFGNEGVDTLLELNFDKF